MIRILQNHYKPMFYGHSCLYITLHITEAEECEIKHFLLFVHCTNAGLF